MKLILVDVADCIRITQTWRKSINNTHNSNKMWLCIQRHLPCKAFWRKVWWTSKSASKEEKQWTTSKLDKSIWGWRLGRKGSIRRRAAAAALSVCWQCNVFIWPACQLHNQLVQISLVAKLPWHHNNKLLFWPFRLLVFQSKNPCGKLAIAIATMLVLLKNTVVAPSCYLEIYLLGPRRSWTAFSPIEGLGPERVDKIKSTW